MKDTHRLYLFYKDELCVKIRSPSDDWEFFYKEISEPIIKSGLEKFNLKQIPIACRKFCDLMYEKVLNGEKLSWDDKKMFMGAYFTLYKFNKIKSDNFIFLKIK